MIFLDLEYLVLHRGAPYYIVNGLLKSLVIYLHEHEADCFREVARYRNSSSLRSSFDSNGGEVRKLFNSSKASQHSSVQVKSCIFYSTLKKDR